MQLDSREICKFTNSYKSILNYSKQSIHGPIMALPVWPNGVVALMGLGFSFEDVATVLPLQHNVNNTALL